MRILIIQLSDMHCGSDALKYHSKITKAIEALSTVQSIDNVVLVFSGDLVNTAASNEYRAACKLLGSFIEKLGKQYNCFVPLMIVPGNHDMVLPAGCRDAAEILTWNRDEHLADEIERLGGFYRYASRKSCFKKNKLYDNRVISFGDVKLQFCLLNSAPYSTRKQDNKELHYFPAYVGEQIQRDDSADIKISVIHHSYEWCEWDSKQMLKRAFATDDITFFGHDHSAEMVSLITSSGSDMNIIMGGRFDLDVSCESAFNAIVYDHCSKNLERYEFQWSIDAQMFIKKCHSYIPIRKKTEKLSPIEAYVDALLVDKHQLSSRFTDYYVMPKLIPEGAAFSEIVSEEITVDTIFSLLVEEGVLGITADNGYGKSALLKYLYWKSVEYGYFPLWVEKRTYDSNFEKMFKGLFEEQYGEIEYGYERFIQQGIGLRILFVDDFDQIRNKKVRENLLEYAAKNGFFLLFSAQPFVYNDLTEAVKDKLTETQINHFKILPFYKEKRDELINSICSLEQYARHDRNTIILALDYMVQCQASLFTLAPDNLTQYIKFILDGGKQRDKGIRTISLVIETNIRNAIMANTKQGDTQIYLAALEYVAHHMYFILRSEFISIAELESTISEFNKKRRAKINAKNFFQACLNAHIFVEKGDSFDLSFSSKNTFAYFVAKYVARTIERNPPDLNEINYIMSHICFGINDIIIMFLSFISSNIGIIIKIAITAYNLLESYPELDFDINNMPFLMNGKTTTTALPSPEEKKRHHRNTEAVEKVRHDAVRFRGIFDFDEDDVEKEMYKVARAFKYTQLIARTLVDQFGNLEAEDLDTMTYALYSLPQRILFAILAPYQNHYEEIVLEVERFVKARIPEANLSVDDIKEQFADAAIMLVLNVMNDIAYNASDLNTVEVLRDHKTISSNHLVQRLMMIENTGNTEDFVREALVMYKNFESMPFVRYLIMHIARKHIIHTAQIDNRQIDKLVSGGLFESKGKRKLLLEHNKQKNS